MMMTLGEARKVNAKLSMSLSKDGGLRDTKEKQSGRISFSQVLLSPKSKRHQLNQRL